MAIFLLIRHGENDWVGKKLAGRLPGVHLNERGQTQAEKVAQVLKNAPISAIYSSPMERAVETAQPLSNLIKKEITLNSGLQEIDFGDWQGKSIKQLSRRKLWKTVQESPQDMVFPGGESFKDAQTRLAETILFMNKKHAENDLIACFSHSDSIRLLVNHFLHMPLADFQRIAINTASISVVHITEKFIRVPFINQIVTQDFSTYFNHHHKKES